MAADHRTPSAAQTHRTIMVAGSRSVRDANTVNHVLDHTFRPGDRLIHGAAAGADSLAGAWAAVYGVPTLEFRPEYGLHGKAAPHVRNDAMLDRADLVVVFWDSKSKGTESVIDKARKRGIPLVVTNL